MAKRGYIEGQKDHLLRQGRGAETSDRLDREAWGIHYGSAYSAMVALPDEVKAGDLTTARGVQQRVEEAIEHGGWTTNEWRRLNTLLKVWARRAAGNDVKFNLQGWQRQGSGHHTPSLIRAIDQINKTLTGDK